MTDLYCLTLFTIKGSATSRLVANDLLQAQFADEEVTLLEKCQVTLSFGGSS